MSPQPHRSLARSLLLCVLIAGTLDIGDALVFYGVRFHVPPDLLLKNIASHLLGRSALHGGPAIALLGLAIHYTIATFWIALFFAAAQRFPLLFRRAVTSGAAYGLLIYVVMNYIVLPHTVNPSQPTHVPLLILNGVLALVCFMGITVAWLNRAFSPLPAVS